MGTSSTYSPPNECEFADREVRERHLERAAHFGVQMRDMAGEAVGRQPFRKRVGVEERAVDLFRRGREYAVQTHGVIRMTRQCGRLDFALRFSDMLALLGLSRRTRRFPVVGRLKIAGS